MAEALTLEQRLASLSAEKRALLELMLPGNAPAVADWFYTTAWRPTPVGALRPGPRRVVIVGRGDALARDLARRLGQTAVDCVVVDRVGGLAAVLKAGRPDLVGYLSGPAADLETSATALDVVNAALSSVGEALEVVNLLLQFPSPPRLALLTRGAAVPHRLADAVAGVLWGLGKALALDLPELSTLRIDLPVGEDCVERLAEALLHPDDEDQIAVPIEGRQVLRLVRQPVSRRKSVALRPDASYAIAGALSGVTLSVARWLADSGARNLVLLGQGRATESAASAVSALRGRGVRVVLLAGLALEVDLGFVMAEVSAQLPPVAGLIHLTAEAESGVASSWSAERLTRPFSASIGGATSLLRWATGRELDFFLLLSSSSMPFGGTGQLAHLACDGFLERLAAVGRGAGIPLSSASLGAWAEEHDSTVAGRLRARGVEPIRGADGEAILSLLLQERWTHTSIMRVDWARYLRWAALDGAPPFLADFAAAAGVSTSLPGVAGSQVRELSEQAGRALVLSVLTRRAATTLELPTGETLSSRSNLSALGLDSLMALDLRRALRFELGVEINPALLLAGLPLSELAEQIHSVTVAHTSQEADVQT